MNTQKSLETAIQGSDIASISAIPNLNDVINEPIYGKFSNKGMTLTNPLPLQYAILYGKGDVVQFLLEHGARPNMVHPQSDCPPAVHIAVSMDRPDLIYLIVTKGGLLETHDENGLTPLHAALLNAGLQTFQTLLSLGALVLAVNRDGDTVIHAAARLGKWQQYSLLAYDPRYANVLNSQGLTAAQIAGSRGFGPVSFGAAQLGMIYVDAMQWNALKSRVTTLEVALSQILAEGQGGVCPICRQRFEPREWTEHVRKGCRSGGD